MVTNISAEFPVSIVKVKKVLSPLWQGGRLSAST